MASDLLSDSTRALGRGRYLRDLWQRREFAWYLAIGKLRSRNASTALGLMWWVLNPLLLAGIYYLVFGLILNTQRGDPNYLAYLVSGLFVFHYTSQAMTGGAHSILAGEKLLVNLNFPRIILPLAAIIEAGIGFLVSVAVFFVVIIPFGDTGISWSVLLIAPAFVVQTLFNVGLAAFAARLAVPFRDINNLLPYLIRLWLYLSPIIWPISTIDNAPGWAQVIMKANPMFWFLDIYRGAMLNRPVDELSWVFAIGWALAALVGGVAVFVRQEGHMVRYL